MITFHIGWPQAVYLLLVISALGYAAVNHGKPRDGEYNFWYHLLGTAIVLFILQAGGFFQ